MEELERLLLEIFVPRVAVLLEAYHHPIVCPNVTLVRLLQPENADLPMLVTLAGILILVRLLQKENADLPMLVTLSGISMLVRLLQFRNASFPMLVTLSGISMLVRLLQ